MFVLGIDPGLTRCGYGLVEGDLDGRETLRVCQAGVLETDAKLDVEVRLAQIHTDIDSLLREFRPEAVVVERVFFQRNAKTAIPVAQASGIAVGLAGAQGLSVRQFTAQQVKLAVTGYGAASKEQVQEMVARLCGLREVPRPPDAADAIGLAITYFVTERVERRWAVAGA